MLHLAASLGHRAICELLVQRGADIEHKNTDVRVVAAVGFSRVTCDSRVFFRCRTPPPSTVPLGVVPRMWCGSCVRPGAM